jgi:hypothetical protein
MNERRLAADLLIRFTDLRSIEFVTEDKQIFGDGRDISGCPIVSKMPLRLNDRAAIPGLAKLESLYLEERALGWFIFTLPTLEQVALGPMAKVPMAYGGHAAPNITSFLLGLRGNFRSISHIFSRLPNLKALRLSSYYIAVRGASVPVRALGRCTVEDIYRLLKAAPGLQELAIGCVSGPYWCEGERYCPNLSMYPQLRKIEMTEDAFIGGAETE